MKMRYKVLIGALLIFFLGFEWAVITAQLDATPWIEEALQGAGVFVALIAAAIALHASDKKERHIDVGVEIARGDPKPIRHSKERAKKQHWNVLTHDLDEFESVRVHFKMVNNSGFTLRRPILSFRLPVERRHLHRFDDGSWAVTFNSNLYNSRENLRFLQFGDTAIISNTNLPFWNHGDELVIWIRMAKDAPTTEPFQVEVSVNAENARGQTHPVTVNPEVVS